MNSFIEELTWRGLIHNIIPGTEEQLNKEMTLGYIGFDPTADSLHVGSLVPILLLVHFQRHGHKPVALVGGSTGMIGDPSGKSTERNLLDSETLQKHILGIKSQLERFLDFDSNKSNAAILVNNYDWMKDVTFLDFARDIGKHITVNYMMAKDSVKKRLNGEYQEGMSFTEFTYQLLQGFDFYHLYKDKGVKLQMGGSDQWGNLTTGTELIRKKIGEEAFALTCPLTTKANGTKFGKSEGGENVWLDVNRTSVFKFYQFWLNITDIDAEKYIKIYTFLSKEEIESLIRNHNENPSLRILQKKLAEEVTRWVHGKEETDKAIKASSILFGKSTKEDFLSLDETTFLSLFEGVPQKEVSLNILKNGISILDALSEITGFLSSKNEAKRALKEKSISVNQEKISDDFIINESNLIQGKYVLLQRGKKSYFILKGIE
ncbi:tyrosine--tRNA ligase [Apibacter sp. B3889]|uniref:tyrosine--tRNA ligase n=1 Tax=unclassified Apibacter TaxID=2630820 RepID=UPI0013290397|nr:MULTISPECIES: tyrosine--tRNA ligase [unclassified Apibacter]MXO34592.1 tyrosine--tRNA ligase [Apibacter sp. B3883]MXO42304.1 tyrosine--tRNA ligase [Apibacter sp. B3889]MXP03874.1 tyrosine--tRNA ligase [Apibacter sp. B3887]MXP07890.1 tyrosine--tRNA ligase [Apibacter sp. B3935]